MRNLNGRRVGIATLGLMAMLASPLVAQETWIVGEGSNSLWIFDPVHRLVIDEVSMPERTSSPTDLSLATVPGFRHDEVFVGAGGKLVRFDRASRNPVEIIDLSALIDGPATVRDLFSALPTVHDDGTHDTLLYVLVDVTTKGGGKGGKGAGPSVSEPRILVLDQEVLMELETGALVRDLEPIPTGEGAWTGSGLTVADEAGDPQSPRVWATIRNTAQPETVEAHRFSVSATASLSPVETRLFTLAADAVDEMRAAVLPDHDDAVLPLPGQGTILNLTSDGSCVFEARVDAGVLHGPAGGYAFSGIDAGGTRAIRFNAGTCDAAGYALEYRPTAISAVRQDAPADTIISHRDDDRITMLSPGGEVETFPLGSPRPGRCTVCPGESETAFGEGGGGCPIQIQNATDIGPSGQSPWTVEWTAPGCVPDFDVWCTCLDLPGASCGTCYCPTPETKGCVITDWATQNSADRIMSGPGSNGGMMPLGPSSSPWKHLGSTLGGGPDFSYQDNNKFTYERVLYGVTGIYW